MNSKLNAFAWALVRSIAGASLAVFHGYGHVFGGGVEALSRTVAALGFPRPLLFAWAAALSELVGGALVAIGLFTRPAALFTTSTLAVALYYHVTGPIADVEKALLYFGPMLAALLVGGGRFSLDAALSRPHPLPGRRF